VRIRALIYALSQELFGAALQLRDFPVLKGLRILGLTDSECYANRLAEKFDYKNTYFDREPRLDIADITGQQEASFDLLIASEVFEHVRPPFERVLENASRLLRPEGVLLLSMPYEEDEWPSREHFPQFADAGLAQLRSGLVLVNRTAEGELQVFDNLVFHGGLGFSLEMRFLNESALRTALIGAGFTALEFHGQNYASFGIRHQGPWSLPIAARKRPFELQAPLRAELMQQFGALSEDLRSQESDAKRLRVELEKQTVWAHDLEGELEKRTKWALELDAQRKTLESELGALRASWWSKLGRKLRLV
jgi:SAM-dependent methyltransferase